MKIVQLCMNMYDSFSSFVDFGSIGKWRGGGRVLGAHLSPPLEQHSILYVQVSGGVTVWIFGSVCIDFGGCKHYYTTPPPTLSLYSQLAYKPAYILYTLPRGRRGLGGGGRDPTIDS